MSHVQHGLPYEALRDAVAALAPAKTAADRTLVWADATHTLALARDAQGRLEVFVVGEPLHAIDKLIAQNLEHQVWTTASGVSVPASRLVLPGADHFDGVAAFICTELLDNGIADDRVDAFRRSEPVIALALRRGAMSNQAMVGLAGELFVLGRLVHALPHQAAELVSGWFGSVPSSRDLQLGSIGIEIKTTTGSESVHHIQGLHQVELGASVDHKPETHLFLLSIGIEWLSATSEAGSSIPSLVEAICRSLPDDGERGAFLDRVKQYGGDAAVGYDHAVHRHSQRYDRLFQTRFERLYDLADKHVHLLRSPDVREATHVEIDSIGYRVRLPAKVRGDLNPVAGMSAIVARINSLRSA